MTASSSSRRSTTPPHRSLVCVVPIIDTATGLLVRPDQGPIAQWRPLHTSTRPKESTSTAASRLVTEKFGLALLPEDFAISGHLKLRHADVPSSIWLTVFVARNVPRSTSIRGHQTDWVSPTTMPEIMDEGDRIWLREVLLGHMVTGWITHTMMGKLADFSLKIKPRQRLLDRP